MAVTALKPKNAVESLRDIVQDLLVPELKAIKAELDSQRRENETHFAGIRAEFAAVRTEAKITTDSIRTESQLNSDSIRAELKLNSDSIRAELKITSDSMRAEIEALRVEMRIRDERQAEVLGALRTETSLRFEQLNDKLGTALEVRERLAILEDRNKRN